MKPLKRRYYRPSEAADELGTDEETIRQYVLLRFEEEPERIPIYLEMLPKCRVLWIPEFSNEIGIWVNGKGWDVTGRKFFQSQDKDGTATLLDVTGNLPVMVSSEFELGSALWLEIETCLAHDIAALPRELAEVHCLRAPDYALGPIPADAWILPVTNFKVRFSDCWISALDVERFAAECQAKAITDPIHDQGRREKQIETLVKAANKLGFELMAIPSGGKSKIKTICFADESNLFTNDGFRMAWRDAVSMKRIKSAVKSG